MGKENGRLQKSLDTALQRAASAAPPGQIQSARSAVNAAADMCANRVATHAATARQAASRESQAQNQRLASSSRSRDCLIGSASAENLWRALGVARTVGEKNR